MCVRTVAAVPSRLGRGHIAPVHELLQVWRQVAADVPLSETTLAREKGPDLAFKRRLTRQNGRSVLTSDGDSATMAIFEAANGIPQTKCS